MKGGKRRKTAKSVQPQHAPPPLASPLQPSAFATTVSGGGDMVAGVAKNPEESERFEATEAAFEEEEEEEEEEGKEEDSEQLENSNEELEVEAERRKLADGYYLIEAVRSKRIRKGQVQYLIKWQGWSEAENTWEPLDNLLRCSDVIDAFEESLKAGKSWSMRKRKRRCGISFTRTKKNDQQQSPTAATYNVPSHRVRIKKGPIPFPQINDSAAAIDNGKTRVIVNRVETSKNVNENGLELLLEGRNEKGEFDLKLCELKGATITSECNMDRLAVPSQVGQVTRGDAFANGLEIADVVEPPLSSQCIGARKRKSGSVKRFKNGPGSYTMDVAPNARELGTTIARIIKPISYQISISNNFEEVLVAFDAVRLDGTKVTVDNKFLKANNPLLLIDFYEKNLRYCSTC
ncbi:chromo domain LHP1-like [Olea europaea subsp. europaea]|uniref:Chromo domain LHP1-like n=1 Tax=Olea europaea subsp. europaea TaxID=158383 RepID=A0A8S0R445_OLEEU|nr:chromo domain LHP1-like [Olea europaea subsp. europaea]CAA2974211.1 chromo domain LHP1-like [Olea europaea subsp. europaea]